MIRTLLIVALLFGIGPGDKKKGRQGNSLMRQERFEEAAAAYREALADFETAEPDAVHSGLLNNLGAALYRQGDFEGAQNAFEAALALAPEDAAGSAAAYNSGGAAYRSEDLEGALARYRQALLEDPSNEDARFNYEFVRRQLEQQENENESEQQDDQNQDQEQDQDGEQNQDQNEDQQDQQDQEQENQDQQDQQDQPQDQQPQEPQDELSQEEAQRILEALENEEEQLLRQVQKMKTRPRRVEKDW